MKRIKTSSIIIWSVLFIIGFACAAGAVIFKNLAVLFWILAAVVWVADGVLITVGIVRAVRSRPKAGGAVFAGNQANLDRTLREANEAVSRYLATVNRKGFSKQSALYERPWFLMCGTPRSGKTSLLRGSGLSFPKSYPSDRDGAYVEGSDQTRWFFGNEAVWIDTPGSCMEERGRDEWQSLVQALSKVRPGCPVDGVALVVNIAEVLAADDLSIKELAQRLRGRIDDMIAAWGIEFPVYLLFNRTDEIPGFNEYFAEQIAAGGDEVFGATVGELGDRTLSPRMTFITEFNLLAKSLTDVRLDRLNREQVSVNKRMICRFVIHFQSIQQKLGVLVAELFKESHYVGKPFFRGFYFTSCRERDVNGAQSARAAAPASMSATIINHPLNPSRGFGAQPHAAPSGAVSPGRKELRSIFVLPLFRGIMVRDKPLVKSTRGRTRRQMIRRFSIIGVMGLLALGAAVFCLNGYANVKKFYGEVGSSLSSLPPETAPLMDQYGALSVMQGVMGKLQKYEDRVPLSMGIGLYKADPLISSLKRSYFSRLRRCMIAPAVRFLEYDIRETAGDFGELAGTDYDKLYRSLKAYLSISEAAMSHPKDIDTSFLRSVMFEAIRQTILSSSGTERLPEKIETVLQENMGLLLTYLRRGEFPAIQENQRLVADARSRLKRLPGAASLYEGVAGQLAESAPRITLDDLLGRSGSGILASGMTVSAIYTQDGWNQSVKAALRDAAENPYRVDWVIGLTRNDIPEEMVDKGKLFDEMTAAYCDDFQKKWCAFLGSVTFEPFVDVAQSSRMLQKLASEGSETEKFLQALCRVTLIKDENAGDKAVALLKKTAGAAKKGGIASNKMQFSLGGTSPFDNVNATFDQLRSFSSSSAGALSGYAGYREKVLTLVDRLSAIQADDQVILVITGRDDDPLYAGWKFTKAALGVMPEDLSAGLGAVLLKPLEMTGIAAGHSLTRALNTAWQREVLKPFVSRFASRYPFNRQAEDASWNDVMDYFRPGTGTFWGFYDRVLSPYLVKTSSGWMVRQIGGMSLNFNPEVSAALSSAERIRDIFFKPDGTVRTLDCVLSPQASNKNTGMFEVDGQIVSLSPGSKSVRISWPQEGAQTRGAALKIQTGKNSLQEMSFKGPWGLLKLLDAAQINKSNASTFTARWQVNVQNMYMLYFEARIQSASAEHPFAAPVFRQFKCPVDLIQTAK